MVWQNARMRRRASSPECLCKFTVAIFTMAVSLTACEPQQPLLDATFTQTGMVATGQLDEISGLQASRAHPGIFWVHNDDGEPRLHAIDASGADHGYFNILDAGHHDWEDLTLVPSPDGDWLVIGDIGDNKLRRDSIQLYFVAEPAPLSGPGEIGAYTSRHSISLHYPDGPRDAEAMAFDALTRQLLILTKRDLPPRLYGLRLATALAGSQAQLQFLGTVDRFRPPSGWDMRNFGNRAPWVSQPTGMDIAADGGQLAVISYRSVYLFERGATNDGSHLLEVEPLEFIGPPGQHEEAISYEASGRAILVTTEGQPAPLFRFELKTPDETSQAAPSP